MSRGINGSKKDYQPRTNIVKDDADMVAYSHGILYKWKNCFFQVLHVHGVNDVRQTEMHTAEPFVPEPSSFRLKLLLWSWKDINCQVLVKLCQYWFKQEVIH